MTLKVNSGSQRALLSVNEAAHYIGVSRQWLDRDRSANSLYGADLKVPYVKISTRKVLYRKSDLQIFLQKMSVN